MATGIHVGQRRTFALKQTMTLTLLRFNDFSTGVRFDPEEGSVRTFARTWSGEEGGVWQPIGAVGWLDLVGLKSEIVALYRDAGGHIELYCGSERVRLGSRVRSQYDPPDPGRLPWRPWGTSCRRLRLYEGDRMLLEFEYRDDSIWGRLIAASDGVVHTADRAYDLLYELHRLLQSPGELDRALDELDPTVASARSGEGRPAT